MCECEWMQLETLNETAVHFIRQENIKAVYHKIIRAIVSFWKATTTTVIRLYVCIKNQEENYFQHANFDFVYWEKHKSY